MARKKLSAEEIAEHIAELKSWINEDEKLKKRFAFEDFALALAFVNRVGAIAEKLDHHPDITFGWGYAELALTTHDRGGITDVDIALAGQIDAIP